MIKRCKRYTVDNEETWPGSFPSSTRAPRVKYVSAGNRTRAAHSEHGELNMYWTIAGVSVLWPEPWWQPLSHSRRHVSLQNWTCTLNYCICICSMIWALVAVSVTYSPPCIATELNMYWKIADVSVLWPEPWWQPLPHIRTHVSATELNMYWIIAGVSVLWPEPWWQPLSHIRRHVSLQNWTGLEKVRITSPISICKNVKISVADLWHFGTDPDPRIRPRLTNGLDSYSDPDVAIFVSDLQDSNLLKIICLLLLKLHYIIFKDKKVIRKSQKSTVTSIFFFLFFLDDRRIRIRILTSY